MSPPKKSRLLDGLDLAALVAWAVFLLWTYGSGLLADVLHPSFHPLTLFAGIGLVLMAGAVLAGMLSREDEHACACAHAEVKTAVGLAARIGMRGALAVPIVFGLTVPMSGLSVTAIKKRGIRTVRLGRAEPAREPQQRIQPEQAPKPIPPAQPGQPTVPKQTPEATPEQVYEELTFRDLVARVTGPEGEAAVEKLRVAIIGQHYSEEDSPPNAFKLYRVIITCCLADAEVMALHVQTAKSFTRKMAGEDADRDEANALLREARATGDAQGMRLAELVGDLGGWVRVMGRVAIFVDRDGYKALQIKADKVERVEPPAQKYLFAGGDGMMDP